MGRGVGECMRWWVGGESTIVSGGGRVGVLHKGRSGIASSAQRWQTGVQGMGAWGVRG